MHDKFIVVDGETVEEGSFNFTAAEKKNAKNVLALHDSAVAQRYRQEWERLWNSRKSSGRVIEPTEALTVRFCPSSLRILPANHQEGWQARHSHPGGHCPFPA